jgi:hypothetical protein
LQEETGLAERDIKECARTIIKHVGEELQTASKRRLVAAKKKYSNEKYGNIAHCSLPTI